jgi:hypothetical protein
MQMLDTLVDAGVVENMRCLLRRKNDSAKVDVLQDRPI